MEACGKVHLWVSRVAWMWSWRWAGTSQHHPVRPLLWQDQLAWAAQDSDQGCSRHFTVSVFVFRWTFPGSACAVLSHHHEPLSLLSAIRISPTEEPKTGPSASGVASPVLRKGEESPSSAFWKHSSQCSPGYHSPSFPPGHFPGSCSINEEVEQDQLLTHRVHPTLLEPFLCSNSIPEGSDLSWKTLVEMKNGRGQWIGQWFIPFCPNSMQTQLGEEPGQQNVVLKQSPRAWWAQVFQSWMWPLDQAPMPASLTAAG